MSIISKIIRNFFELIINPKNYYLKLSLKYKMSKKISLNKKVITINELEGLTKNQNPRNNWDDMANKMIDVIKNNNVEFLKDPNFNPVHGSDENLAYQYFNELLNSKFFVDNILFKIRDPIFGGSFKYNFFSGASTSTILHYKYIDLINEFLCINLFKDIGIIYEIGGGYGNFARIVNTLGFKGLYNIVDLKTMGSIQKYYLQNTLLPEQFKNINFIDKINTNEIKKNKNFKSILIASYSVSEMQIIDREELEEFYYEFDYLFFAYQEHYEDINNIIYFQKLLNKLKNFKLIKLIKDCKRSNTPVYHLLIGKK